MTLFFGQVLIVDDEPQIRQLLRAALQDSGLAVLEAHDGQEAILRTSVDKPSLIVLDLGLPDLQGLEVIKRVRECTEAPIIGLTAIGRKQDRNDVLASGANDYLAKPFRMSKFVACVRATLPHRMRISSRDTSTQSCARLPRTRGVRSHIERSSVMSGTRDDIPPKDSSTRIPAGSVASLRQTASRRG